MISFVERTKWFINLDTQLDQRSPYSQWTRSNSRTNAMLSNFHFAEGKEANSKTQREEKVSYSMRFLQNLLL